MANDKYGYHADMANRIFEADKPYNYAVPAGILGTAGDSRPEYVKTIQRTCLFSGEECLILVGRRIAVCNCPAPHYTTVNCLV